MEDKKSVTTSMAPSDPVKVPDSWFWIKGSDGNASVSTTFAAVAFFVTTLMYVASAFLKIGPVELRPFDVAACSVYFSPVMMLYFGRRWVEAKYKKQETE